MPGPGVGVGVGVGVGAPGWGRAGFGDLGFRGSGAAGPAGKLTESPGVSHGPAPTPAGVPREFGAPSTAPTAPRGRGARRTVLAGFVRLGNFASRFFILLHFVL